MGDRPKSIQLTSEEIDRLLADSSLSLHNARPWIAAESTFSEEDLALLDETGMLDQPSSAAVEKGHNENVIQGATQILSSQTERIPVATSEVSTYQFKPDPTISASPADSFSSSACVSSPLSVRENLEHPHSSIQKRNSLSKLVHGWTTLMGHPITGSISSQLSSSPQSVSIFSPLITQSSKLLTGVVSSFLSPWAVASGKIAEESEDGSGDLRLVKDRLCEDSLIDAFERIGVADSCSEHDDVFFSPNHERDEAKTARRASISLLPTSQCGLNVESSVYSDAISAQPSPVRSAPETTTYSMALSSQRPSTHRFDNPAAVSSSHLELQSEVESLQLSKSGFCTSRLANVAITPSVSANKSIAEEDVSKITRNLLAGVDVSPKMEVLHRDMLSTESEISEGTFAYLTPSHEAFKDFTVEWTTPTKLTDVNLEGPEPPAADLNSRSASKLRVSSPPFPMEISMLNADEGDRTRKSSDRSPMPIILPRKSKSVVDRQKETSGNGLVSRESVGSCRELSKRCEMTACEQLSPQESNNIRSSASGNMTSESATPLSSHCPIPSCPSSEHLTGVCGVPQSPLHEAVNSFAFTDSEQEDKENVYPHASATVTGRRATHRIRVLSVATAPVPAPRRSAHKAKTLPFLPTDGGGTAVRAQLRREIKILKAKEDVLRLVLSNYETAFEEALDQRSQMHFAAASARAQASDEVSETRRQAATLYNAVLDSQRRHDRIHEAIERAEANQKELLKRVEALRKKHAHQSEKGVTYQKYCLGKIQRALENQESMAAEMERELSKLRVHSKQMEMKQRSLEAELRQKAQENQELTRICDSLLT